MIGINPYFCSNKNTADYALPCRIWWGEASTPWWCWPCSKGRNLLRDPRVCPCGALHTRGTIPAIERPSAFGTIRLRHREEHAAKAESTSTSAGHYTRGRQSCLEFCPVCNRGGWRWGQRCWWRGWRPSGSGARVQRRQGDAFGVLLSFAFVSTHTISFLNYK